MLPCLMQIILHDAVISYWRSCICMNKCMHINICTLYINSDVYVCNYMESMYEIAKVSIVPLNTLFSKIFELKRIKLKASSYCLETV